jgi:hypothetical protein
MLPSRGSSKLFAALFAAVFKFIRAIRIIVPISQNYETDFLLFTGIPMSKLNIGGLNFSSFELTWMAVATIAIVTFGYLIMRGLPIG